MNYSYIAYLEDGEGSLLCEGKGRTKDAAATRCLGEIRRNIKFYVVREDGISLPESQIDKVPMDIPEDRILVVLERCSHNSGNAYDWRYVAVPKWNCIIHPSGKFDPIEKPKVIPFMDCNAHYEFELPLRSFEFKDGIWCKADKIVYNY